MHKKIITIATWNVSEGITASWNLHDGINEVKEYEDTDLILEIIQNINKFDLDIVCFQEFPISINHKELIKDKIYKNTELKYSIMLPTAQSFLFSGGQVGVAIFSKYPIIESEKTYFNNPHLAKTSKSGEIYKSFDKGIIHAKIETEYGRLSVITGHAIAFGPFDKKAEDFPESYLPLSKTIIDHKNEKLIACGDFNTPVLFDLLPNVSGIVTDIIEGKTTQDIKIGETISREGKKSDYILINEKVKKIEVCKIDNLSDHYLIISKLNIL